MDFITFFIVLSILILVHELGHFIVAKRCGVKVERFALGFGPKLLSRIYDGTEFALCLIPLGGYVKMAGDERTQCKGEAQEFCSQPIGHRALIVLMGPVVNYALAYVCLVLVFLLGYPCLSNKIGEAMTGYPAETAGLKTGDRILRINGQPMDHWEDVQTYISTSQTDSLVVDVQRDHETLSLTIIPRKDVLENIFGQKENVRVIGIKPTDEMILLRYGFGQSLTNAFHRLWEVTWMTYKALYRMMTGAMSPKDTMTGPIGIFFIVQKAAALGFTYLVYIVGTISASLAIFNLLPLPVLDGGHLLFLGIEKIRGRALSQKTDDAINKVGMSLILCLALFVFYIDFKRFGWIEKIVGIWQHLGL